MKKQESFIPETIKHYLIKLCQKAFGIFLVFLSLFFTISLLSFTQTDNSFTTASTFQIKNLCGKIGSNYAKFMYELLGLTSFLTNYFLYIFGRYFIKKSYLKYSYKKISIYMILSTIFLSLNLSYLSNIIFRTSPTQTGLGGLTGFIIKSDLKDILTTLNLSPYFQIILVLLSITLNILTLYYALNMDKNSIIYIREKSIELYIKTLNFIQSKILKKQTIKIAQLKRKTPTEKSISSVEDLKPTEPKIERKIINTKPKYILPTTDLLNPIKSDKNSNINDEINVKKAKMLENILTEFGIEGKITSIKTGPVITLFEMEPGRGIKTSRITALSEDIARNMSALSARVAVIPGTNKIGIELPNTHRKMVYLREQFESSTFAKTEHTLPISLGSDTSGNPVFVDLAKMPHLLIAGTTGSGKSVGVNGMILSLLYKFTPDECKFIMIDPKMLEFSVYNDIPHLLIPVVIDPIKAVAALKWAVREMEERNRNMSALGAKNIESYNQKAKSMAGQFITREVQTGFDPQTGEPIMEERKIEIKPIPYIVVIVDEMADLMLVAGKEVEAAIARLAAMARAAGIHLILSTQRPSVDVITGTIKSNFPNRISYRVASKIDSRTIINEQGAELMLGKGDMLYMAMGGNLIRIHGAFVSEDEIEHVVTFIKAQAKPNYVRNITSEKPTKDSALSLLDKTVFNDTKENKDENLYNQAVQIILEADRPSISYLQRRLGIGYNKSANLIEKMQENGILSAPDSTGKRTILTKNQ